jgi:uncharacterized protein involved in exopolysaccharide biosynthesis
MDDEINLRDYIDVIKRRWKIVVSVTLVLAIAALIYSLMQKPVYEAKTTILIRSGGSSALSQFSGLAGMVGVKLPSGGGNINDLSELLQSKIVAAKVIDDLKLRDRVEDWSDPNLDRQDLIFAMQGTLDTPRKEGNYIEIKVSFPDAKLAAEIANAYVEALSFYWNRLNYTAAQKKKQYVENQLPRVNKELKIAEERLKRFTLLSPKGNSATSSLMGLVAGSQSQGIEVRRLSRELDIQNSVYTMLRKEYESVKLEESKEISPFSVVDKAVPPKVPTKPRIKLNTLMGMVLGIFSGIFIAFFREYWDKDGK